MVRQPRLPTHDKDRTLSPGRLASHSTSPVMVAICHGAAARGPSGFRECCTRSTTFAICQTLPLFPDRAAWIVSTSTLTLLQLA